MLIDHLKILVISVLLSRIKRCLIIVLAVLESETVVKNLAELLLVYLFEAWTGTQGQKFQELSQLLIELGQPAVLPDFLDLLKWQIAVTVFVVEIQILQKLG